eukprot:COSAG02_NODE_51368_length_314_cov_1.176744_2_plen_22_part_01
MLHWTLVSKQCAAKLLHEARLT